MQKQFLTFFGLLVFSTFMYAQNIHVQTDWQLLGTTENIDTTKLDGKCIDFIWKYDNGWKVHVANNQSYDISNFTTFNTIEKGEGFWIKGSSNCDIDTNSNANQDIKALLASKTFYTVDEDVNGNRQVSELIFNQDATYIHVISPNKTEDWSISIDGNRLVFSDDTDGSYSLISQVNGYIYFDDRLSNGAKDGDGHRLYGTKAEALKYLDSLKNSLSDLKFTKELLSANPWYKISYTDSDTYCEAKFTFDENYNLTASWLDDGKKMTFNGNYAVENGKLITHHDDKKEVESLISDDNNLLTVKKEAYDEDTGKLKNTMNVKYFKNRQDALNFGSSKGVDCSKYFP